MRYDYLARRKMIARDFGVTDFKALVIAWYTEESMSAIEIVERIKTTTGYLITPRTIQRILAKIGKTRSVGDAFRLAAKKGRVHWAWKDNKIKRKPLQKALRYHILKRDGFRCVLCGSGADTTVLEIDHIIAICKGGSTTPDNIRTLCHECNIGKRIVESEK